jgi:hypothetical protein
MSDDADTIIKHEAELRQRRSNFDTWWQDIAYRVLPAEAQFTTVDSEGTKRTERLFDSSAAKANRKFAAILEDLLTPRTQRWHGMEAEDDALAEDQETDEYFEAITNVLFKQRYNPRSMFAAARAKNYLMLGPFGNAALFIEEVLGAGRDGRAIPAYTACHMREITWAQDRFGRVDTVYRKYPIEGREALKQFRGQLSKRLSVQMEDNPFKTYEFIHCTKPNEERISGRADYRGMDHSGFYVSMDDKAVVQSGGYREFPWAISRYQCAIGETFARSPAMECWPSIMTLQEEKKSVLRAGQREAEPPVLLTEDGILGAFSLRPSALNYGALSSSGDVLAAPFKTGANIPLAEELMAMEKSDVDDSFLVSLWNLIVSENVETAAQVFELARMRAINLAPIMGRMDSEDLGPMIHREYGIAARAGRLPDMPERLVAMGAGYQPVNTSPLAKLMKAQDGLAIVRTVDALPTFIAVDKRAANAFRIPEMAREMGEINGVPAKFVRSLEEMAAIDERQAQAENAAAAAATAPEMSQAVLNVAKAEQARASV